MDTYFTPKPKPPSTVPPLSASSSSHTPTLNTTSDIVVIDIDSLDIDLDLIATDPVRDTSQTPQAALLHRLWTLTTTLPLSVPLATPDDVLAAFSSDPRAAVEEGEDLYEQVVNPALHNAVGYNMVVIDVAQLIRRGPLGMDGFYRWIEICLVEAGIEYGMLEVRVERVCDAMKLLYVSGLFLSVSAQLILSSAAPKRSYPHQSLHQSLHPHSLLLVVIHLYQ